MYYIICIIILLISYLNESECIVIVISSIVIGSCECIAFAQRQRDHAIFVSIAVLAIRSATIAKLFSEFIVSRDQLTIATNAKQVIGLRGSNYRFSRNDNIHIMITHNW